MFFCHMVINSNEPLILYLFDFYLMIFVCFFCIKRRQSNSATAYNGIAHSSDRIIAYRTNIEFRTQYIG